MIDSRHTLGQRDHGSAHGSIWLEHKSEAPNDRLQRVSPNRELKHYVAPAFFVVSLLNLLLRLI